MTLWLHTSPTPPVSTVKNEGHSITIDLYRPSPISSEYQHMTYVAFGNALYYNAHSICQCQSWGCVHTMCSIKHIPYCILS